MDKSFYLRTAKKINSVPNNNFIDWSKLKTFEDDNMNVA